MDHAGGDTAINLEQAISERSAVALDEGWDDDGLECMAQGASPAVAAGESGGARQRLHRLLQGEAREFNFFRAVQLLEAAHPEGAAVGYQGPVDQEAVRFRGNPSLGFPSADIDRADLNGLGQLELATNFAGLYGPASPLPVHLTEAVIAEQARIDNEDLIEYFLSDERQLRALRDHRLNVTALVREAEAVKKQLRAGVLQSRALSDGEFDRLCGGEPLAAVLEAAELDAFRQRQLVLQIYERPSARQRDFLDLFNHRLISLFYRGWKKYRPQYQYRAGAEDPFSQWLFALMGAPDAEARAASAICWPRLLGFLGILSMQVRSIGSLCAVVSGYFGGIGVGVEEHIPRWAEIDERQRCRLGVRCTTLGEDLSLGTQVRDHSGKFRVSLGPLASGSYKRFTPGGADYPALKELITFLMPEQLLFDIELRIRSEDTPPLTLLAQGEGCQLGWSSWLGEPGGAEQRVVLSGG